jgi:hypothetical protein
MVLLIVFVTVIVFRFPSFTAFGALTGLSISRLQHKPTAPATGVQVLVVESETVVSVIVVVVTGTVSVVVVVSGGP